MQVKDKTAGVETQETPRNEYSERCNICISETASLRQKISQNSKVKRVKTFRGLCSKAVCKKHMMHICFLCQNKSLL